MNEFNIGVSLTMSLREAGMSVPGDDRFQECATKAKAGRPISKLLNAEISMDAKLA